MNSSFLSRKNNILDQSLDNHLYSKQKRDSLIWGAVNAVIFAILWIHSSVKSTSWWIYAEYVALGIAGLSLIYNILRYLYYNLSIKPVKGSIEQKKMLSFAGNEFHVSTPKSSSTPSALDSKPAPINVSMLSWQSFGSEPNLSLASSSWLYNRCNADSIDSSRQGNESFKSQSCHVSPKSFRHADDSITEEKDLKEYLKQVNEAEEKNTSIVNHEASGIQNSPYSFWNNRLDDVASLLKTSLYQLSPLMSSSKPKDDLGAIFGADLDIVANSEELRQISSVKLAAYVANLRMWISNTILQRVVKEMNSVNETLRSRGFSDIQIGSVGLERLKKTAENRQLIMHVPTLPMLVPFLDMTTNQEYLVQRLKDLGQGKCIADYRWNSGAKFNGVQWNDHLPTDSSIVFHAFCTYLDSQLMPLPDRTRPFTSRYVITNDAKKSQAEILNEIKNRLKCGILYTNALKPKFNFISDGKVHNCAYDRNNLFNVLIQFLIYMKTHNDGSLEGVSLGKRGINILCCIEETSQ